jgi:RNA polymerase sigma-70 factor (ECF subfamily)
MQRIERSRGFNAAVGHTTVDVAGALRALSDTDLVRLKTLARLWSRGLPGGIGWTDVLNEAIVRVLDGSRPWPPKVPLLAFMSGVMRSICDDHWRRARREVLLSGEHLADVFAATEETTPDPERVLAAAQALAEVHQLFAGDRCALMIIAGLSDGMSAQEICQHNALSEREYDTARKRMRRALLRYGLVGDRR